MSMLAPWFGKAPWGWEGLVLGCGIMPGGRFLAAGSIRFSSGDPETE